MIFSWTSIENFNIWHDAIQNHLGIPKEGTDTYTIPTIVSPTDVRALVKQIHADLFPDLIGELSEFYRDPNEAVINESIMNVEG
jgi:hypothetical protein